MTMPDLHQATDSKIVTEVCFIQPSIHGLESDRTMDTLDINEHATNMCKIQHTMNGEVVPNGDVNHTHDDVIHINEEHMNNQDKHVHGVAKESVNNNGHQLHMGYFDGNIGHNHQMSISNKDHRMNSDEFTSTAELVKQTEQGRSLTTDTQPHNQHFNGATMYDLCERLSSVGMEETAEGNSMYQQIQNSTCLQDTITEGQSVFAWTHSNVFSQDKDGDTCLHIAVILQELNLVFTLINTALSHRLLSTRNNLYQTPLYLAVLTNQIAAVRRLMVGGAEIDSRDRHGNTPLHVACGNGNQDIAATLLEPVRYHETKLNQNYEIPYQKIPQNLEIANYDGKTVLHLAAERGHFAIVKLLVEKRADINGRDGKTGRTVLHNACLSGDVELVRYLLSCRGCNLNARAYDDYTPFDFARIRGHTEIAIMLAHAGARQSEENDFSE